jgi:hypothetical protein
MIKKTKTKLLKKKINLIIGGSSKPSTTRKFTNFFKSKPKMTDEEKEEEKKINKFKKERNNAYKRQEITTLLTNAALKEIKKNPSDYPDKMDLLPVDYFLYAPINKFKYNKEFNEFIQDQYEFLTQKVIESTNDKLCEPYSIKFLKKSDKFFKMLINFKQKFTIKLKYKLKDIPLDKNLILSLKKSNINFIDGEFRENFIQRCQKFIEELKEKQKPNPTLCFALNNKCKKIEL